MTGTLPSIPLAQNFDENGLPQSGCRLFVYQANTSTPVITYKDLLMSAGMEHPWPIVGDALGRIPMFFVPDGYYRARLEDRYGTPLYDEAVLPALSTGEGGGGGGAPAALQWASGDFLWQPYSGTREGWVRANGLTIGNALSGASERANADCANLFTTMWGNFPDSWCPVSGGRGATSVADFDAGKSIALYDMRGFFPGGLDGMGNVAASRFVGVNVLRGGDVTSMGGTWVGANMITMTEAQMPYHVHDAYTALSISLNDPGHAHAYHRAILDAGGILASGNQVTLGEVTTATDHDLGARPANVSISSASATTTIGSKGASQPHINVPYAALGTWFVRL
jgi:microcystin-dependent protein